MNWQPLLSQVDDMMRSSQISLEEFKDIIGADKWYEHPAWSTEQWWFGDKKRKSYMTFQQLYDFYHEFMDYDPRALMDALRKQIEYTVDELIANEDDLADREVIEIVKEVAA